MKQKVESVDVWRLYVLDQEHRMTKEIESLAHSILATGQINPITVCKEKEKGGLGEYRVIAGRRRFAALSYIQEHLTPEKHVKALVMLTNLDALQEEMIKIDENIMRQNLVGAEFDEAIYRRKQIYEQLFPETKQHASGGHAKTAKAKGKKSHAPAFTTDAARKLQVSKRTVEKAVARIGRTSDKVKKARESGLLTPSKVDLLVSLSHQDQDLLLPLAKGKSMGEFKTLVEMAKRRGARAVVYELKDVKDEDQRIKPLMRAARSLRDQLQDALTERLTLEGDSKHESLKELDQLVRVIDKFASFQRAALGYVKAIKHKDGERKLIRARA